jgi:hypothetical protein
MSAAAAQADRGYPTEWDDVPGEGVESGVARDGAPSSPAEPSDWPNRKLSQVRLAVEMRERLVEVMGGKCVKCGTTELLEFHHPHGRDWVARKKNQAQRMRRYLQDFLLGNLELLCGGCNKSVGKPKELPNGFWQRSKYKRRRR